MTVVVEKSSTETREKAEEEIMSKGPRIGIRHVQSLLMFLLLASGYSMRVNLSVAIVSMTKKSSDNPDVPVYDDWDNKSYILSSFYIGYICLQVLAGELGKRFGVKWLLVNAMVVNSVGSMLIPLMAKHFASTGVLAVRVVQGMFQGFFFPSVHNILGKWAPKEERSTLGNLVFTGIAFGTIIALPLTGIISASWSGWPLSFHVFGGAGLVWCVLWIILGSNNPAEHKYMSIEERVYIESSLNAVPQPAPPPTPWRAILTSTPVWAIVVANSGQNWGYSALLTEIPNYLSNVGGVKIEDSAYLATAPYLALFILGLFFGPLTDFLVLRNILSIRNARKLMNSIDNINAIEVFLVMAVGINAAIWCGFQVNHVDLSPKFSGILMGIANGFSNIFSIISPMFVQWVVPDESNASQWRVIFILAAAVYVVSDIFYLIYAQAELQWWDNVGEGEIDEKDTTSTVPSHEVENK
ncbi:putative inorganic phosphate cotransporter isoform X2 [Euwallacea fornicatus]|uniref:putative inorganic phosphate cotransporter isoform X2 n=1 Tax=Euwallacea fornicatus TaxID=995702 RepID=UPI00338DD9EA